MVSHISSHFNVITLNKSINKSINHVKYKQMRVYTIYCEKGGMTVDR